MIGVTTGGWCAEAGRCARCVLGLAELAEAFPF